MQYYKKIQIMTKEIPNTLSLARRYFDVGYALYLANLGIEHCQNEQQRRGWLSANRSEAESATPGYAQRRGW